MKKHENNYHFETIRCAACGCRQTAMVIHECKGFIRVHGCVRHRECGHINTDADWQKSESNGQGDGNGQAATALRMAMSGVREIELQRSK